jgi:plastocyanin
MKKFTLFLFFTSLAIAGYSTTHTVVNSNFTFSPATLTIQSGDSVRFTLANIHTVVEVSQNTWNNNDNTPLSGGFQLPNGGGLVLPAKLTVGTHWYVCGPHASAG